MLTLGFDTTGPYLALALLSEGRLLAACRRLTERAHARELAPTIDRLYREAGVQPGATTAIGVTHGPGSFTGIRIGLSTAQALAEAWAVPVYGFTSLAVLADNLAGWPGVIYALLDARRERVYFGRYRMTPTGPEPLGEVLAAAVTEVLAAMALETEPVALVGDGAWRHRELWPQRGPGSIFLPPPDWHWPRGETVARWAEARREGGDEGDPLRLAPFYLRPPAVER